MLNHGGFPVLKRYQPFRCIQRGNEFAKPRKLATRIWAALAYSVVAVGVGGTIAAAQSGSANPEHEISAVKAGQKGRAAYILKDYAVAMKWLQFATDGGDVASPYFLGIMYRDGLGQTPNYALAMKSFQTAANRGYVRAQTAIGQLFLEGKGVARDQPTAMTWLLKAADQGEIVAQGTIGLIYYEGIEGKPDYAAAITWYRKAAEPGVAAQLDVPPDLVTVMNGAAQFAIGNIYERGGYGVVKDIATAKEWYGKAAEQGYADAKKRLAQLEESSSAKAVPVNLMCDMALLNGKKQQELVSVDLTSKYIKIDTFTQGVLEYRDGVYGTIIKSGFMLERAAKVQQFVTIDDDSIKFGFKKKDGVEQTTIDRRTLRITIAGAGGRDWVNQCSLLPSQRQL
jgi:TPR repeat protein